MMGQSFITNFFFLFCLKKKKEFVYVCGWFFSSKNAVAKDGHFRRIYSWSSGEKVVWRILDDLDVSIYDKENDSLSFLTCLFSVCVCVCDNNLNLHGRKKNPLLFFPHSLSSSCQVGPSDNCFLLLDASSYSSKPKKNISIYINVLYTMARRHDRQKIILVWKKTQKKDVLVYHGAAFPYPGPKRS